MNCLVGLLFNNKLEKVIENIIILMRMKTEVILDGEWEWWIEGEGTKESI